MTPFRFRGAQGALFGVLHEPEAGRPHRRAMLMCAPFGQEAIRSQRLFRVIAERLARAGCATLRFDPFGTGDSDGDERDASLAAWIGDVPEADRELRRRTGATSVGWFGLRLGASIAAMATRDAPLPPSRLVLWDAVESGPVFLAQADAAHRAGLARAFPSARECAAEKDDPLAECMGFALTPALRAGIAGIGPDAFARARAARIAWIADREPPSPLGADPRTARAIHRAAPVDWATDEAMNASIVPADVVAATLQEAFEP